MRVEGGARGPGPAQAQAAFAEVLARTSRAGRGEARAAEARRPRAPPRPAEPHRATGPGEGPEAPGEEASATGVVSVAEGRLPGAAGEVAPAVELAAAVRALPPAAAALAPGGALALSFGRALDVELRVTGAGVDVVLRPAPGLARAAEAELPRLVAALRARGVRVARVEVRPRGPAGGRSR